MSPALSGSRLSLADQALANLLGFLAAQIIKTERTAAAVAVLDEVLPHVSQTMAHVAALGAAAAEVIACFPRRGVVGGSTAWYQAMLVASGAVEDFLFWRASLATDAWRQTQTPNSESV